MNNDSVKKTKILIIEDEHSLVDLLSTKLKKEGFDVEFSYDGEAGYEKAINWNPDIILLDNIFLNIRTVPNNNKIIL